MYHMASEDLECCAYDKVICLLLTCTDYYNALPFLELSSHNYYPLLLLNGKDLSCV